MKGTPSFGKHSKINHIRCRRCGRHSYNIKTSICSACGFGRTRKIRNENWRWRTVNRKRKR
ncbi:MAG: 50S ribosomal protein L37e [Candidatus Aenigmatarchaeota archaeon]